MQKALAHDQENFNSFPCFGIFGDFRGFYMCKHLKNELKTLDAAVTTREPKPPPPPAVVGSRGHVLPSPHAPEAPIRA